MVAANKLAATASEQRLSGIDQLIAANKDELVANANRLSARVTELDGQNVKLGVEYTAVFSQINLV